MYFTNKVDSIIDILTYSFFFQLNNFILVYENISSYISSRTLKMTQMIKVLQELSTFYKLFLIIIMILKNITREFISDNTFVSRVFFLN